MDSTQEEQEREKERERRDVPSALTAFKSLELSWNSVKGQDGKTQMR